MTDSRKALTLEDAAKNPDGTWNGAKALAWISEALSPGQGIHEDEVCKMFNDIVDKRNNLCQ